VLPFQQRATLETYPLAGPEPRRPAPPLPTQMPVDFCGLQPSAVSESRPPWGTAADWAFPRLAERAQPGCVMEEGTVSLDWGQVPSPSH
jgi:hypothetical protein